MKTRILMKDGKWQMIAGEALPELRDIPDPKPFRQSNDELTDEEWLRISARRLAEEKAREKGRATADARPNERRANAERGLRIPGKHYAEVLYKR